MIHPRLRIFAGPNGSGKSVIKAKIAEINPEWLGTYINPDEIEREVSQSGILNFERFNVHTHRPEICEFLSNSNQLINNGLVDSVSKLEFAENSLSFRGVALNSYLISAIADFLHEKLIDARISFSFETVMSHPKKIEVLEKAKSAGFRNYVYFIATEDPQINISRVQFRVTQGGHDVPKSKIKSRYYRTLENLIPAVRRTDRAFIFDNSGAEATLIAEVKNGKEIEIRNSNIPNWFNKYVLDKIR